MPVIGHCRKRSFFSLSTPLNPDSDRDGFDDGEEILEFGTDPLDPLDPTPVPVPEPVTWLMLVAGTVAVRLLHGRRR
jgi:hypothetical protein